MKVTRVIREYVEKEIKDAYNAKKNPYSEQADADRKMIKDFEIELGQMLNEKIEAFFGKHELYSLYSHKDAKLEAPKKEYYSIGSVATKAMREENKWFTENNNACSVAIRNILMDIELGGTKSELKTIIAAALEEI